MSGTLDGRIVWMWNEWIPARSGRRSALWALVLEVSRRLPLRRIRSRLIRWMHNRDHLGVLHCHMDTEPPPRGTDDVETARLAWTPPAPLGAIGRKGSENTPQT